MFETLAEYETILEIVEETLDPDGEKAKSSEIKKNVIKLEESFLSVSKIYKAQYKKEALDKCSEEYFNGVDEDLAPKFKYNEAWFSSIKKKYLAIVNKMDDMLKNMGNKDDSPEKKEEGKAVKALQEAAKN